MKNKRTNFLVGLAILLLTITIWAVSKYIQPLLPAGANSDLVLLVAALAGAIMILTGIPDVFEKLPKLFSSGKEAEVISEKQGKRNRETMLILVWNAWIEGVLKKSLYNEMRLELGLELHPELVENPWDCVLQSPGKAPVLIPKNKKILEVFDEAGNSLVIVGEPGSGKTTVLLELASQAIDAAREDPLCSIPVVFNLSTWTPKLSLDEWLVDELRQRYKIPAGAAGHWVKNGELFLLLDGLDEVKLEFRDLCAQAINDWMKKQAASLVVCCRNHEFIELKTHLDVRGAVLIQPLSSSQVEKYLRQTAFNLVDIYRKTETATDVESQKFIRTPLFISILILTYRDVSAKEMDSIEASANFQTKLFDDYIDQMFKRRGQPIFSSLQTKKWLAWLARQMVDNRQSVFYIENVQPAWFENKGMRIKYRVILGLIGGIIFGLVSGIIFGLIVGLKFGLIIGLVFGLMLGLVVGLGYGDQVEPVDKVSWSWTKVKSPEEISFGLISGLITGLALGINIGPIFGVIVGVISGIFFWLIGGLSSDHFDTHAESDLAIRNSLSNLLKIGLSLGLVVGFLVGLFGGISNGQFPVLNNRLAIGVIGAFLMGFTNGGSFILTHFLLRRMLSRTGKIPFRLIQFLDFAAERILLRKVGGGYIFIHRMLMEHFAAHT